MHIRLKLWQVLLLFLPGVTAVVFLWFPDEGPFGYRVSFPLANLLMVLSVALVVTYQAYLAIRFDGSQTGKLTLFRINAGIPAVFTIVYLLNVAWATVTKINRVSSQYKAGPMHIAQYHTSAWIFLFLLIHAFVTFYFVNNQFVSRSIRSNADEQRRETLEKEFLTPMKVLTKVSIYVNCSIIVLEFLIDIIRAIKAK
jgi:anaerobic C4-dicarboxylate transporter